MTPFRAWREVRERLRALGFERIVRHGDDVVEEAHGQRDPLGELCGIERGSIGERVRDQLREVD